MSSATDLNHAEAKSVVVVFGRYIKAINNMVLALSAEINDYIATLEDDTEWKASIQSRLKDEKLRLKDELNKAILSSKCSSISYNTTGSQNQYIDGFVRNKDLRVQANVDTQPSTSVNAEENIENSQNISVLGMTLADAFQRAKAIDGKTYKLDNSIPVFNNNNKEDGVKINDWLFIVESNMELLEVPEERKVLLVTPLLRGVAFQMAKQSYLESRQWNEFKADLLKTFMPVNHERTTRTRLLQLKQTDSFSKYSKEFLYLVNQLPNLKEEDKLACFLQGLRQRTRTEIELREIRTWSEAYRIAATIELVRDETSNNNTVKHNNLEINKKLTNMLCHKCKKPGHIARNCSMKPKQKNQNTKEKKCYKFGLPGHIAPKL